jgi:thiamine pyrophosphate-dependent acetolactate synthase large subunit-like protein
VAADAGPGQSVADAVGAAIAAAGVRNAFGVLGSGNLVVTNALRRAGVAFHHARHEGGAVCMADGYARVTGEVGICSVHQGPGLTNAITGLTEAAKSRTPMLVLAGEAPAAALTSNFRIAQDDLVRAVGAGADRIHTAASAPGDGIRALTRAALERRPVVLMLPIDLQAQPAAAQAAPAAGAPPDPPATRRGASVPAGDAIAAAADLLAAARRPAIIAGRGAVLSGARDGIERLGELTGALLATSAPAHGLFAGLPYALGISGGFASPAAARLLAQADLVLFVGASGNHWTTRHGELIDDGARVMQIDDEPGAIGRHRPIDAGLLGDAAATVKALVAELERRGHHETGFRVAATAARIASGDWLHEPYEDAGTDAWIDPRTLSIELERRLPALKTVAVDSGHSLGYPAMFLSVADARAWVFPNGFQSVGLGLGSAIGAAVAHPERVTVAAIGDGGAFMALAEIETAVRLGLRLLVVIYDDAAYGAEVHHFGPIGHDVDAVRFPDCDLAAIARAAGARGELVRRSEDLAALQDWLLEPDPGPLVLDAKVNPTVCAQWLAEAFRGG